MKVKVIESGYLVAFEHAVNNFLINNDVEVIDIKYSTYIQDGNDHHSCMIIYEQKGEENA